MSLLVVVLGFVVGEGDDLGLESAAPVAVAIG